MAFLRMRGRTRRVSLWATRQRPPSRTAARQALGGGSSKTAAQRGRTAVGPGSGDVEPAPGDVWCGARARMLSVFNTGGVAAQLARQSGLEDLRKEMAELHERQSEQVIRDATRVSLSFRCISAVTAVCSSFTWRRLAAVRTFHR
jgi:hypothetical protein